MTEAENILSFFNSPVRRAILSVNKIEKESGLSKGDLSHFLHGRRGLPQHHLENLIRVLILVGYQPVTNDYQIL